MSAILYLYRCRFKNWFRQALRKPAKLILFLFLAASMLPMFFMPRPDVNTGTDDFPGFRVADAAIIVIWLIVLVIVLTAVYSGAKSGSLMFSMADTQFVFTGPFRPQNVLLYGMLNMMTTVLFSLFFLLYQVPNLRNAGLNIFQILTLLSVFIVGVLFTQLIQQTVFLFTSKNPNLRGPLRSSILFAVMVIIFLTAIYFLVIRGSFIGFISILQNRVLLYLVPFIGWFAQMLYGAFSGLDLHFFFAFALMAVSTAAAVTYSYHMDADFYEDAVNTTQRRTELEARARQSNSGVYLEGKRKVRKKGLGNGSGENSIFFLHLVEQRRLRPFFVGFATILYTALAAFALLAFREEGMDSRISFLVYIGVTAFSMFFLTMDNPLLYDLQQPIFYYMPGSSYKKVLWSSFSPMIYTMIDLLPSLLVLAVLAKIRLPLLFIGFFLVLSFYLIYLSAQMLAFWLMGTIKGTIASLVYFLLRFILLLPATALIIAAGVLGVAGSAAWYYFFVIAALIVNIVIFLSSSLAGRQQLRAGLNE